MLRLLATLILTAMTVTGCRTASSSDTKEITNEKTDFHGRKSHTMHANMADDIKVSGVTETLLTVDIRTVDSGVFVKRATIKNSKYTFVNFLRIITDNYGQGYEYRTVHSPERRTQMDMLVPEPFQTPVQVGDLLGSIEFCSRFVPDTPKPKLYAVLVELTDSQGATIYRASPATTALCK